AGNSRLAPLEQDVLWEYAKLNDKIRRIANLARLTADSPNEDLLSELRVLEKKMGLVLTLYKASVYAVMMDSQAEAETQ
ncbi:DASH complex subunit Dad3, partial [Naematelia encephala]